MLWIDLGVNAAEVVPTFCLLLVELVGIGENASTLGVADSVVATTNPNAVQMALRVNFIVCFLIEKKAVCVGFLLLFFRNEND